MHSLICPHMRPEEAMKRFSYAFNHVIAMFVACSIWTGCSFTRIEQRIGESQAKKIAISAVKKHYPQGLNEVTGTKLLKNGNWYVFVELFPNIPGAHMGVEVCRKTGKVVRIFSGA